MNSRPTRDPGPWRVSTPGRVCLFGEHQDYLDLPVISAAVSLRLSIEGRHRQDLRLHINAPDIGKDFAFELKSQGGTGSIGGTGVIGLLGIVGWRKFLVSGLRVLLESGYTFSRGIECTIRGNIPIRGGASSSSAMVVSWINLLAQMSDQAASLSGEDCALLAWRAEVAEAGGAGGRMDQYATAVGGLLFQSFFPVTRIEPLPATLGTFVLGDSQTQKDTQAVLARVKDRVQGIVKSVSEKNPGFSLQTVDFDDLESLLSGHAGEEIRLMRATIRNRDITREGHDLLRQPDPSSRALGEMLNEQQSILGGTLGISTPLIDGMIAAALSAGAAGCKINGSGGGGCMFAYAPESAAAVAEAIASRGGRPYVITVDEGTRSETAGGTD